MPRHLAAVLALTTLSLAACGGSDAPGGDAGASPAGGSSGSAAAGSAGASAGGSAGASAGGSAGASAGGTAAVSDVQGMTKISIGSDIAAVFAHATSIDGLKFSDYNDPTHCKLRPGGKKKDVVLDGPKGEDNSFGKNIVPILLGLAPDAEETTNEEIAAGASTLLVRVEELGGGATHASLFAELFSASGQRDGSGKPVAPTAWATYSWRPYADLVDGDASGEGDALRSVAKFPASHMVDNLWVSGARTAVPVELPLFGQTLRLTIHQAVLSARYAPDHLSAKDGILSGVLDTDEFTASFRTVSGKLTSALCDGTTIDNVLMQMTGASDIMKDGTQGAGTCDGISIGLGFETKQTRIGKAAPPAKPTNVCPPLARRPAALLCRRLVC